jgi:hypothetical protein
MILDKIEFRKIARHFRIATSIVWRHRHYHMKDAFRRLAQRLEGADCYNSASVAERLMTLNLFNLSLLSKAIAKDNISAAVKASNALRANLEFESELLGQLKGVQQNEVILSVVYENSDPRLAAEIVPRSAEPQRVEQSGTTVQAGVQERIGGYRIERETSKIIEAEVVPQPLPRPQRQPARLARQPRALLSVGAEQPFTLNLDTKL